MRRSASLLGLLLGSLSGGCGMTDSVQSLRRELRRHDEVTRSVGDLRLSVEREGTVARVRVEREQRCHRTTVMEGDEEFVTTRSAAAPGTVSGVAITGAGGGLLGVGVMLCPTLCRDSGERSALQNPDVALPVGATMLGIGALLAIPWIYTRLAAGSTTETRPYSETVRHDDESAPCGVQPERAVVTVSSEEGASTEHRAGEDGRVDLDLDAMLPAEALRGGAPWRTITVSIAGSRIATRVDLGPYRVASADRQWRRASSAGSADALERFAIDFNTDPRADEARGLVVRLRRSQAALARDEERRTRWTEAGDDRELLRALIDEDLGDVWEAEALCRLGAQETNLDRLRPARDACSSRLTTLVSDPRNRNEDILRAARRALGAIASRVDEAERLAREAEASAAEARARAERHASLASRAAYARARALVAACRAGRQSGAAPAREAYAAIARARATAGRRADALVVQVAAACRCTPACAGVSAP